jgi:hypothetical protein
MPDPLLVLPYELWTRCIKFAIEGQPGGPLEFTMISKRWHGLLFDSPSLWNEIYLQNGEDELARIVTFLHLSKSSQLHIDIMTVLPTTDGLQLIAENISRVTTISLRPDATSGTTITLHTEQWKQTASFIMATMANNLMPSHTSCFGISLWETGGPSYHVIFMEFTMATMAARTVKQNCVVPADSPDIRTCFRMWEKHITRCASSIPY